MSLPRKSEFDVNLLSADYRLAGANVWAYGDTHQVYPSPNWPGWNTWDQGGAKPGGGTYWSGDVIDYEYYYDACRVFYGIADYTGDAQWNAIARKALIHYMNYVQFTDPTSYEFDPPQAGIPAYFMLPHGCYLDYLRNPDATARARARKVLFALANNPPGFGASWSAWTTLLDLFYAREVGYNLTAKYLALDAGYHDVYGFDPWGLTDDTLVGKAFAFVDQAISLLGGGSPLGTDGNPIDPNHKYVRPFMMANLAIGLMHHYEHTGDSRVIPKLTTLFEFLWTSCYRQLGITLSNTLPLDGNNDSGGSEVGPGAGGAAPASNYIYGQDGMLYTDRMPPVGVSTGDNGFGAARVDPEQWEWIYWDGNPRWYPPANSAMWPTSELNGLILPVYFWLYQQTGDLVQRARADALFDGLVRVSNMNTRYGTDTGPAYDNYGKGFNQMYSRIWPYAMARIYPGVLAVSGLGGRLAIPGSGARRALPTG